VISSTTSSLPEVVGDGGLLVDPYDTAAIAGAIRAPDQDDALCDRLSAAGLAHAARFSDQAFAAKVQGIYAAMGL
jgi:glycosyltransferase involved in cell wall biosynthesis